ncbi:hypothetical protein Pmani_035701 [Petrolisthes manimaculis]|uniref:Uncharacterized protein n=1 Tax=Petrolisthes manimaculis TaxID=1843537 RepID=A0AAE1NME3_9EUCA|nr:hypothetical protein Pmani_035701 [Petrolisthes manimaculis]
MDTCKEAEAKKARRGEEKMEEANMRRKDGGSKEEKKRAKRHQGHTHGPLGGGVVRVGGGTHPSHPDTPYSKGPSPHLTD